MNFYKAFDIPIQSELNLTPLEPQNLSPETHELLKIYRTNVSRNGLNKPTFKKALTQISDNHIWFDVPNVARFLIKNGNQIHVDPYPNVDEDTLSIYILGSCMGAVLHQRHFLVLHANAVRISDGIAILFIGESGSGKSTTAAQFHKKGFQVLSDDLVVIDTQGQVVTGLPYIKLWQHSLEKLNIPLTTLSRVRPNINKYRLPTPKTDNQQRPLVKAIYNLKIQTHTKPESLSLKTHTGFNRFKCLTKNTYRGDAIIGLGLKSQHLKQCSELARNAHIMEINRPVNHFSTPALVKMVMNDLHKKQLLTDS